LAQISALASHRPVVASEAARAPHAPAARRQKRPSPHSPPPWTRPSAPARQVATGEEGEVAAGGGTTSSAGGGGGPSTSGVVSRHAPRAATLIPALRARHLFAYVIPLQPQTGSARSAHATAVLTHRPTPASPVSRSRAAQISWSSLQYVPGRHSFKPLPSAAARQAGRSSTALVE